jgi:hypothetical protein
VFDADLLFLMCSSIGMTLMLKITRLRQKIHIAVQGWKANQYVVQLVLSATS